MIYNVSVSFRCTAKWFRYIIYIYVIFFFQILFHHPLLQDIKYSSLCYKIDPCLSILYIAVCIYSWLKKKQTLIRVGIVTQKLNKSQEKTKTGNSLVVQWLGLSTFTAMAQSLVRELRSCKLCGMAKKQQQKNPKYTHINTINGEMLNTMSLKCRKRMLAITTSIKCCAVSLGQSIKAKNK